MLTELRLLVLGLLARQPRSAYALGRALSEMPTGGFSGSPGAIYPAVRAMEGEGLLEKAKASRGTRGRTYVLTRRGHRVLRDWLVAPVDGWALVRAPGIVLLRLSFLSDRAARARLRRQLGKAAHETLAMLRTYHVASERDLADSSDEAIALTEALLDAYVNWARPHSKTGPHSRRKR